MRTRTIIGGIYDEATESMKETSRVWTKDGDSWTSGPWRVSPAPAAGTSGRNGWRVQGPGVEHYWWSKTLMVASWSIDEREAGQ